MSRHKLLRNQDAFVGLISGTSVDGIDACVVTFDPEGHLGEVIARDTYAYPDTLKRKLVNAGQGQAEGSLELFATLDQAVGQCFAHAAESIIDKSGLTPGQIRGIGHHGQTVLHAPDMPVGNTLQIGDPNRVAHALGRPVVADFRRGDVACGGQGAPLAPGLHQALWRGGVDRVILNIGGIANITALPADPDADVLAFDTGPGNGLMDAWAQGQHGMAMDEGGRLAAQGNVDGALLAAMRSDPYFALPPPKSTGRETFSGAWMLDKLAQASGCAQANVPRTLLELTASTIADAIRTTLPGTEQVYVCGGGVHNPVLMQRLAEVLAPAQIDTTTALGVAPDIVEAVAFAWLAMRRLRDLPGNLPSVTGARRPVRLGAIYDP